MGTGNHFAGAEPDEPYVPPRERGSGRAPDELWRDDFWQRRHVVADRTDRLAAAIEELGRASVEVADAIGIEHWPEESYNAALVDGRLDSAIDRAMKAREHLTAVKDSLVSGGAPPADIEAARRDG